MQRITDSITFPELAKRPETGARRIAREKANIFKKRIVKNTSSYFELTEESKSLLENIMIYDIS